MSFETLGVTLEGDLAVGLAAARRLILETPLYTWRLASSAEAGAAAGSVLARLSLPELRTVFQGVPESKRLAILVHYPPLPYQTRLLNWLTGQGLENERDPLSWVLEAFRFGLPTNTVTQAPTVNLFCEFIRNHAESGLSPYREWFDVPPATAAELNATHRHGGRVIAVGTTVVRALESAVEDGEAVAASGWTGLIVTPERGVALVDGLLTGFHEPEASHLDLLRAFAPDAVLEAAYAHALERGYLWHEFGDVHLLL